MIVEKKCSECFQRFEVTWDDNIDSFDLDFDDSDCFGDDMSGLDDLDDQDILFCPFCGAEVIK